MAVHVHWMGAGEGVVVDDEADGAFAGEVVDVGIRGEFCLAELGFEENGIVVVATEGGVVDIKEILE